MCRAGNRCCWHHKFSTKFLDHSQTWSISERYNPATDSYDRIFRRIGKTPNVGATRPPFSGNQKLCLDRGRRNNGDSPLGFLDVLYGSLAHRGRPVHA